jgi:hypothetical protein
MSAFFYAVYCRTPALPACPLGINALTTRGQAIKVRSQALSFTRRAAFHRKVMSLKTTLLIQSNSQSCFLRIDLLAKNASNTRQWTLLRLRSGGQVAKRNSQVATFSLAVPASQLHSQARCTRFKDRHVPVARLGIVQSQKPYPRQG